MSKIPSSNCWRSTDLKKWSLLTAILCAFSSLSFAASSPSPQSSAELRPFTVGGKVNLTNAIKVSVANGTFEALEEGARSQTIALPISETETISLDLERFDVVTPGAKFLIGSTNNKTPAPVPEVVLFRGKVSGDNISHVYYSLTSNGYSTGYVTHSGETYYIAHKPGDDFSTITKESGGAELPPFVNLCGVGDGAIEGLKSTLTSRGPADSPRGPRVAEIALDADQKYYNIFGNVPDAQNYLVQLLGAVSDIYMSDVNMKLMISFMRIWSSGGEPFDQSQLDSFKDYWNNNEDTSGLDIIHLVTGRRDLGFGGIAYVSAYCSDSRYSISGYENGSFPSPVGFPSIGNWDLIVMAHEMGHNFGTLHTHDISQYDPLLDSCAQGFPSRGTIMSYCHIHPGYTSNIDVIFPSRVQAIIETDVVGGSACFWFDCNGNGINDSIDIASSASADINSNNIPDECEDCNGNGIFDNIDIAGSSNDVNSNGIPDECEPDCDGNGIPDEWEANIVNDINGNNILDECEVDCNNNDTADFIEIAAGTLEDFDHNNIPDMCQDCNNNSVTDWRDLQREFNLYVADRNGGIHEYHAKSGVPIQTLASSNMFYDVVVGDDRMLYATADQSQILKINPVTGSSAVFWDSHTTGIRALTLGPDGNLYVGYFNQDLVHKVNGTTGADMGIFVTAASGGLDGPSAMTFGPNGNLFVASENNNSVKQYSGTTGILVNQFVLAGSGGLDLPRGLTFKPDGNLLVTSFNTSRVYEYNGTSGAFVKQFNDENNPNNPWGITIGPNGDVFTVRTADQSFQVFENLPNVGRYYRSFVRRDLNLVSPAGLAFMPVSQFDCNGNFILDACEGPTLSCCCVGNRGDVNGDATDANILDLTFVVDFIFRGSGNSGPCIGESDINGDGSLTPNILDLTYLVDRIFRGGPMTQACVK